MAKNLIEFSAYDADIVSYSSYTSSKTVLGEDIFGFSASTQPEYYIGPNETAFRDITQDTGVSNWGAFDVMYYRPNRYLVFCVKGNATVTSSLTQEIALWEFNKSNYTYSYRGESRFSTLDNASTIKNSLKATLEHYSTGTVQVTGTTVSGVGTNWLENRIPIGARIGFGSTNPENITNWYRITDYPLMNNLPTRTNNVIYAQTVDPSTGKIYIGGLFTLWGGVTRNRIARLNTDGTLDLTFDPGVGFNDGPYSIAVDSSGKIYVGGPFTTYQGVAANRIIKLNQDGSKDTSFDNSTGFNGYVIDIKFESTGKLWLAGAFTTYKGVSAPYLTKLNTDGTRDTSYPNTTNPNSNVYRIVLDNNENLYIGGVFTQVGAVVNNSRYIAKILKTGGLDSTFNVGVAGTSNAFDNAVFTIQYKSSTNTIIVGGQFSNWKAVSNVHLTEIDSLGNSLIINRSPQPVYTLKADTLGNIYCYAGGQLVTKRNINTLIADPNFTPNIIHLSQTNLFDNLALNLAQNRLYVRSANTTVDSSLVCVETTGGTRDTTFFTSQDYKSQVIRINSSPGDLPAGTPYVVEEIKLFTNDSQFGIFIIQGVSIDDFAISPPTTVAPAFNFMALSKGAYKFQASNYTVASGHQLAFALNLPKGVQIDKINDSTHYLYSVAQNGQIYRFNLKDPYITSIGLNSNVIFRFAGQNQFLVTSTGIIRSTGGGLGSSSTGKFQIATMQTGSAAGVKSIYMDNSGVVQIPISSITNEAITIWSYMPEIPPGSNTTYTAAGNVGSVLFSPEIDSLVILNLSTTAKSYITRFRTDFIQPNLSNTLFTRDRFNQLALENSYDLAFLVNGNQLQGSTSNPNAPKYPDTLGVGFFGCITDGVLHLIRPTATIQNNLYAIPISCEAEYVNTSNRAFITPKYNLPNLVAISGIFVNTQKQYGSARFSLPPEPIIIDYRTSGIDDNTGTWKRFTTIQDLNEEFNCRGTITNVSIQLRFSFKIAGTTCLPNKIYGFSLIYEDDRTDSHYSSSMSKTNLTTRIFAWRQEELWYGNIPDLKIRLYNTVNNNIIFFDSVSISASGVWEHSTDGDNWLAWDSSADAIGNYIRYVAQFVPAGIKLRVGLNRI